jgi:deoxyribonuclease-4
LKIGAHVSASGSIDKAIGRAEEIGAEAIQMFVSGPTTWRVKQHSEDEVEAYRARVEETDIQPAFFHGIYLINLGSQDPELVRKGIDSLVTYQTAAARIGCLGTIFHVGSHKGFGFDAVLPQVIGAFRDVLDNTPEEPWLIIENSAGMGNSIGASFTQIGKIIREAGSDRVKVCIDTQHSFANGYHVGDKGGLADVMDEFEREIGLERLVAVHANDSKCELDGGLDRHENIGEGYIGLEGFEVITAHPAFEDVPFLLEVPGVERGGPDRKNIDTLKAMRPEGMGGK